MKPAPPDEKRIEIVINGDQPETHRAALDVARILSAGQMIPAIRKSIEECRERINKVSSVIVKCSVFVNSMKAYKVGSELGAKKINEERRKMMSDRGSRLTFDSSSTIDQMLYGEFKNTFISKDELCGCVTPTGLLPLVPPEDMQRYIDILTCSENVVSTRNFDDIKVIIDCHERICELLKAYLPKLHAELVARESELSGLIALVRGR